MNKIEEELGREMTRRKGGNEEERGERRHTEGKVGSRPITTVTT